MSQKRLQEQLDLLREVIDTSPYLARESREQLEKEIAEITFQMQKEDSNLSSWEKRIFEVNVRVASDEVTAVMHKINHLNPSSPRLAEIRHVASRLGGGEISPEQGRVELHRIMQH